MSIQLHALPLRYEIYLDALVWLRAEGGRQAVIL